MLPHTVLTDEELLLASRMGDYKAQSLLAERLHENRFRNCYFVAFEASNMLDDWSLNEAYFRAFLASISGYRFLRMRFITYFFHNLRNEIIHLATKKAKERADHGKVVSLDEIAADDDPEHVCTLSDFVASGDFMDDPRAFLSYAERLEELHRMPEGADPLMLDVVRLTTSAYTIEDTAKICCISTHRVKYLLSRYRKWALHSRKLIESHGFGGKKKPRKKRGE